jgi:hypothetical protein
MNMCYLIKITPHFFRFYYLCYYSVLTLLGNLNPVKFEYNIELFKNIIKKVCSNELTEQIGHNPISYKKKRFNHYYVPTAIATLVRLLTLRGGVLIKYLFN